MAKKLTLHAINSNVILGFLLSIYQIDKNTVRLVILNLLKGWAYSRW